METPVTHTDPKSGVTWETVTRPKSDDAEIEVLSQLG